LSGGASALSGTVYTETGTGLSRRRLGSVPIVNYILM
jgi:hypothetical protein